MFSFSGDYCFSRVFQFIVSITDHSCFQPTNQIFRSQKPTDNSVSLSHHQPRVSQMHNHISLTNPFCSCPVLSTSAHSLHSIVQFFVQKASESINHAINHSLHLITTCRQVHSSRTTTQPNDHPPINFDSLPKKKNFQILHRHFSHSNQTESNQGTCRA